MAMQMQDLQALYVHKLQDIYSAEQQALDLMEQSVGLAQTPELRQGIRLHIDQTRQHIRRLDRIFGQLDEEPGGETCEGMCGLVQEA